MRERSLTNLETIAMVYKDVYNGQTQTLDYPKGVERCSTVDSS